MRPKGVEPAALDHRTAVFRVFGLQDSDIWHLGQEFVGEPQSKKVLARGDLLVEQITSLGLVLEIDDDPPRHAAIAGWPVEKDEWKSLSQELAARTILSVSP